MHYALVHYHELALKGRNRGFFEQRLTHHLRSALRDLTPCQVMALPGRIRISFPEETEWEVIRQRVSRVFGVANFCPAHLVPLQAPGEDLSTLKDTITRNLPAQTFETFRITTKRANKRFPKTSMDLDRELGASVCHATGKRVNLSHPQLTISVEILKGEAYVSFHREAGPGGLPTGTGGKVLCLISGGIDSPVAAYRMMKRGCQATFIHFHGRPYVSRASEEKVRDLVQLLTTYQLRSRLYLIPFGDIQRRIVLGSPAPLRIVLYRRMMLRIAEAVAEREGTWGLVTGDSLGQVASQTPGNLAVVSEVTQVPILRPLIGMDKSEITREAQQLGTFEISIEPDQDCCTLFTPPHPNTHCRLDIIRKAELLLDIGGLVKQGLDQAECVRYRHP